MGFCQNFGELYFFFTRLLPEISGNAVLVKLSAQLFGKAVQVVLDDVIKV
jgi:hypothetical protein